MGLVRVSNSDGHDFVGRSEAGEHFAYAIFSQRSHSQFACFLSQDKGGSAPVDHVADLIIDYEELEYSHAAFIAELTT